MAKKANIDTFIEKSNIIHHNKYDYSKVVYKNANTKVEIICPKHGSFFQNPMQHLLGQGCPKCSGRCLNTDEIIEKFKEVHGEKYDYSQVVYSKMHEKVKIICKKHGEFYQTPSKHIKGQGCPKCGKESCAKKLTANVNLFIENAKNIHNNKYDYSKVNFTSMSDKVEIVCPKHGSFFQIPYDNINEHGCPKCAITQSKAEDEICEAIINAKTNIIIKRNNREILDGKELDIYLPEYKLGIEYNGLLWHSEKYGKDRNYHLYKTKQCNDKGIRLIHIFEDEYVNNKELVINKILHLLGLSNGKKIMARKCEIKEIDKKTAKTFMAKYHIQGYAPSTVYLGAFYGTSLVGVMTFKEEVRNSGRWDLNRFASDYNYICSGIGGKLFKYFTKKYDPINIKSFADRRWTSSFEDNIYTRIGFSLTNVLKPDYSYVNIKNPSKRIHKFNFRKKNIKKHTDLPSKMTETEMTKILGFEKIWNCGLYKYEYIS